MHQHHDAPEITHFRRDLPKPLAAAITKALAKQATSRWQSAVEMSDALRPYTRAS